MDIALVTKPDKQMTGLLRCTLSLYDAFRARALGGRSPRAKHTTARQSRWLSWLTEQLGDSPRETGPSHDDSCVK
jgi:hypothetical protein